MRDLRPTAKQTQEIDSVFNQIYRPLEPFLNELKFNINTGKMIVPEEVTNEIKNANLRWNYRATLFNKKLRGVKANFGAIKDKFNKDVVAKETKMYIQAIAKIIEEKYKLTPDNIDVDFILKYKSEGDSPEQVCDKRALEIKAVKVHLYKHKHDWNVVFAGKTGYVIICPDCRTQYEYRFHVKEWADKVAVVLPKTRIGLFFNKIKTKSIIKEVRKYV